MAIIGPFQDDFEDGDLAEYSTAGSNGSAGTASSSAPDGGAYDGFVTQGAGGGTSYEVYSTNTFDWNGDYRFEFLIRSNRFDGSAFLGTELGWRGRKGDANVAAVALFDTDSNGGHNPFRFVGGGASNSTTHSLTWKANTYYWVKGECDESTGKAYAKIWEAGNAEPSSYQISCDITTGVITEEVYFYSNGTDTTNLDLRIAHMDWGLPPATPSPASQTITGDDQVDISWSNVEWETGYRLEVSEDGGGYTLEATPGADVTSYTATVATATDTFKWRVRSENDAGVSDWTYTATKSTDTDPVTIDASVENELGVSWNAVDDESGYDVYRAEASGTTRADYSKVASSLAAGTTSYTDTGLEDGERYYYRVDAIYPGTNSLSNEAAATTVLPGPSASSLDTSVEDEITVSWTRNDDSPDGGWEIYRSTDGTLGTNIVGTATLGPTNTSYTDTGLADGEQYHYTVRRVTDHTSTDGTQQSGVTILPAPSALSTSNITDTGFDVSWTVNADNGTQRVEFKRSSDTVWSTDASGLALTATSETVSGLLNGEQYDVRVVAVTSHIESPSSAASATTTLPDVAQPTLGNGVEDEIAVDWTDVINYGEYDIEYRETVATTWLAGPSVGEATTSANILNLEDGEEYEVRLRTQTEHVTGAWTSPVSIVTKFPGATGLTVGTVTATSVDLSWTDNSDNEDGFRVERREQFRSGWGEWRVRDDLAPNTTTYTDGVQPNTTYEYRIEAYTEHTAATSPSVQTTSSDDGVRTDRVPARGWYVVVEDAAGNVYTPSIVGDPQFLPTLNGLPRVEVPVSNPDRWDQPKFEAAPMRVYEDGQRQPIDTFVTVDRSPPQAVLRGRGGSELRQRVERSYESKAVHTASDGLIQTTGYVADVDVPATETITDEVLQEADTTTEFTDNLLKAIPATQPIEVSNGSIRDLQTCFVSEGEGYTRQSLSDFSQRISGLSDDAARELASSGAYLEYDFTTKHDIPEADVGVAFRDHSDDVPEVDWYLNGQKIDEVPGSGGSLALGWSDVGDGTFSGSLEGWTGGTLPAGTHTVRVEIPSGYSPASGEYYAADVVALYDQRYSYTFDNTTGSNGYLDGPELYPDAVDVVMDDTATAYSVTAASVSSTWDDISNNQQIAVSNDFGATWTTAANTTSLSTSFAERGGSVRTRFRFSRYGSRTTATPKTGFQGQSLDAYTLSGDLDDVATLVNRSYDGNVEDVLADIAEYGDLIWEVRWDDSVPGFKVIVTRPGIRTAAAAAALTDYTVTKDASEIVTKAIVYGKSQPARAESVTVNHGTAVDLGHAHLVETSEVVRDASSGTTYARGIDYSMNEQAGTITTNASGSITDGAALEVDYQYRSRGEHAADTHDGSATKEFATTIPAATTDRACQQAALKIVQTGKVPRWTAEATLDTSLLDVPLSSAIDLEHLPTRDESLEVWSVQDSPRSVTLQLGNREEIAAVVDDIQSRLDAVARLS